MEPLAIRTEIYNFIEYIDRSDKTAQSYINDLRQFCAWLLYADIKTPQRADIIAYRDYLLTEHDSIRLAPGGWQYRTDGAGNAIRVKCKPATAAAYLRAVTAFFKWLAITGKYPVNIAENIHLPKVTTAHRKEALTPADVLNIENDIRRRNADRIHAARISNADRAGKTARAEEKAARTLALYLLAVNAGLRTIELSRANVRDLEIINGTPALYVWGKGHTEPDEKKPLAPEVYQALKDYLKTRGNPAGNSPLFVATGNRSGGKRLAARTISTMIKNELKLSGFNSDRITAHSLRHTAGTAVMLMTGDLYKTQNYMRHADPKTTELYLHVDTDRANAETAKDLYNFYHQNGGNNHFVGQEEPPAPQGNKF